MRRNKRERERERKEVLGIHRDINYKLKVTNASEVNKTAAAAVVVMTPLLMQVDSRQRDQ